MINKLYFSLQNEALSKITINNATPMIRADGLIDFTDILKNNNIILSINKP